jgi:hypothetical protein
MTHDVSTGIFENSSTRARVGDFLQNPIHTSCVTQRIMLVATGNLLSLSWPRQLAREESQVEHTLREISRVRHITADRILGFAPGKYWRFRRADVPASLEWHQVGMRPNSWQFAVALTSGSRIGSGEVRCKVR